MKQRQLTLTEIERGDGQAELNVEQRGAVTYDDAERMLKLALFQLERQRKEAEARKIILGHAVKLPHEFRPDMNQLPV